MQQKEFPEVVKRYPARIKSPREILDELRLNAWTETVCRYRNEGHDIESHVFTPSDSLMRESAGGSAIVVMITDGR